MPEPGTMSGSGFPSGFKVLLILSSVDDDVICLVVCEDGLNSLEYANILIACLVCLILISISFLFLLQFLE